MFKSLYITQSCPSQRHFSLSMNHHKSILTILITLFVSALNNSLHQAYFGKQRY